MKKILFKVLNWDINCIKTDYNYINFMMGDECFVADLRINELFKYYSDFKSKANNITKNENNAYVELIFSLFELLNAVDIENNNLELENFKKKAIIYLNETQEFWLGDLCFSLMLKNKFSNSKAMDSMVFFAERSAKIHPTSLSYNLMAYYYLCKIKSEMSYEFISYTYHWNDSYGLYEMQTDLINYLNPALMNLKSSIIINPVCFDTFIVLSEVLFLANRGGIIKLDEDSYSNVMVKNIIKFCCVDNRISTKEKELFYFNYFRHYLDNKISDLNLIELENIKELVKFILNLFLDPAEEPNRYYDDDYLDDAFDGEPPYDWTY